MATAPISSLPPPSATRPSTMTASQTPSPVHNPADLYHHSEVTAHALITNTLQTLDQRAPPSLQEILAAFTSKGDGDRDMLFALLNAKAAEDNRIAAERNLRRSLLEMYKGQPAASTSLYMPEGQGYPMPSPPASTYRSSPYPIRRASRSPSSSQSSDDAYLESRKRRRSRSPGHEFRSHRQGSLSAVTRSDAPLPPSPYSSASSQTGSGSPRSREAMNIGSLLAASGERDVRSQAQQVSYVRRDDDSARRHV